MKMNIFAATVALILVGFSYFIATKVGPPLADFAMAHLR